MKEELLKVAEKKKKKGIANKDGGPFGAVITDSNDNIISVGHNMVLESEDPTNHAEIVAIRNACKKLHTSDLTGYKLYSTCEPCPMCLSAIIWSNIDKIYYGSSRNAADKIGFRDKDIYDYLAKKNNIISKEKVTLKECDDLIYNYQGEMY